jgi:SnoaL-like domain
MRRRRSWLGLVIGVAVIGAGVGLSACRVAPRETDHAVGFRTIVAGRQAEPTVTPGSAVEREAIERLKGFLGNWTVESIHSNTLSVYAPDAWFNDTLKTVRGATNIQAYFLKTMKNTESLTVQFDDVTRSGDGFYYFRWVMDTRLKSIAKGETLRTPGITLVRFDASGRVVIHQDYWDSTAGLFEHVPLLGRGIRAIKARL